MRAAETLRRTTTGTANHYTDRCSQVRNFGEHAWGISMSAITDTGNNRALKIPAG